MSRDEKTKANNILTDAIMFIGTSIILLMKMTINTIGINKSIAIIIFENNTDDINFFTSSICPLT